MENFQNEVLSFSPSIYIYHVSRPSVAPAEADQGDVLQARGQGDAVPEAPQQVETKPAQQPQRDNGPTGDRFFKR